MAYIFLKLKLFFLVLGLCDCHADQLRLFDDLFKGGLVNPLFIPVTNSSVVQRVIMEANLHNIMDVDEKAGILTTLIWLDMSWDDDYLQWDPEEYGNLTRLELPPSQLWTPDVFLFNDATGQFSQDLKRDNPMLVVSNEGHVRWIPPLVVKSMCDIASQKTQEIVTCELKFGSWVYNAGQLDLINPNNIMDLEGYVGNAVWDLDSTDVMRHETVYDCCPEPFVDITYDIHMRRKDGSVWSSFPGK